MDRYIAGTLQRRSESFVIGVSLFLVLDLLVPSTSTPNYDSFYGPSIAGGALCLQIPRAQISVFGFTQIDGE